MNATEREIQEIFNHAAARPYLLCGQQAEMVGAFYPNNSQAYGAAPGKNRTILYGLCEECATKSDVYEKVEAVVESRRACMN